MKNTSVRHLTFAGILTALGILIPMVMPVKIVIGAASFTLASHVPVFIAMFFSPLVAVVVALGTTIGFLANGMPIVIALRALSHLLFAVIGAYYLQKRPTTVLQQGQVNIFGFKIQLFNVLIGILHSAVELIVVMSFNFIGNVPATSYDGGMFYYFFILMGVGGFVHSFVDFNLAYFVAGTLSKHFDIPVFTQAKKLAKEETATETSGIKTVA